MKDAKAMMKLAKGGGLDTSLAKKRPGTTRPPISTHQLHAQALIAHAPPGVIVVYLCEVSDTAYFILKGCVGVGMLRSDEYVIFNYLREGEFFGEVAALTGMARTANIITKEESEFLILPAKVLKGSAQRHPGLNIRLHNLIGERLSQTELPRGTDFDQQLLRELRTKPAAEGTG